jgi:lipopolysaccharide/colanic/teichoic acid biosynthesis glycosyltransferase
MHMRRLTSKAIGFAIILADMAWSASALLFAAFVRSCCSWDDFVATLRSGLPLLGGMMIVWFVISDRLGFNRLYRSAADLVSRAIVTSGILSMGIAALAFASNVSFSRLAMACFVAAFVSGALITRLVLRALMCRNSGVGHRKSAVILGSGPVVRELAIKVEEDPELMCRIVGYLAPESQETDLPMVDGPMETISSISMAKYLTNKNVQQVFVVLPNSGDPEVLKLVAEFCNTGIDVAFVPNAYELYVSRAVTHNIGGIPVISMERRISSPHSLVIKTCADILTVLAVLLITAPFLVITAIVLSSSGRRVLRRELRCGEGGRPFWMYRFNVDRYETTALNRFEQFLVRTSLSELPQIWNVLRGEMSVVGPRPEAPERVQHYSEWERQRLFYKPGITGIAQARGLREQHSSDSKARYDLQYPLAWSPLLDLSLIIQTALTVLRRGFAETKHGLVASGSLYSLRAVPGVLHADRPQPGAD